MRFGTGGSQHVRRARRIRLRTGRYELDLVLSVEEGQGPSGDARLNLRVQLIIFVEVVAELVLFGCVVLRDAELFHN